MATRFNVVVDLPLTKAQASTLNKEIQILVTKRIGNLGTGIVGRKVKIPKEWIGIWVKDFKTIEALKNSVTFRRL